MDIIFGRENAEKLREKYTVLDLEKITVKDDDGKSVEMEVFCLIPAEKIALPDLPQLEQWTKLHNDFLNGYHTQQWNYCRQCIEHLTGKFGGELDTFYEEILKRIEAAEAVKSD
jgi:hypothetical protein